MSDTITINEYIYNSLNESNTSDIANASKQYTISIANLIEILNSIETSNNVEAICYSIGLSNPFIRANAAKYSITYKSIFKGNCVYDNANYILNIIKCIKNPKTDSRTQQSIIYIKLKIYEFIRKETYNNELSEWIGMLAGLMLYFSEIDDINFINSIKTTQYNDISALMNNITISRIISTIH